MTFRLTTLLYLFAIVAVCLSLFGALGIAVAGLWILILVKVFAPPLRRMSWIDVLGLLAIVAIVFVLVWPAVQIGSSPSRTGQSLNNLKQLAIAIHNYHDQHGHIPPPVVKDSQGNPLYSWRVAILPHISSNAIQSQFRYDEPWDSPANSQFLVDMEEFQSPRFIDSKKLAGKTHYFAVVGNETVWNPNDKTSVDEVSDGTSKTLLLIEAQARGIKWSEPRDLTMDEAIELLTAPGYDSESYEDEGFFVSARYICTTWPRRCVAFVDGRTEYETPVRNVEDARALLTISGGEALPATDWNSDVWQKRGRKFDRFVIHWGRIWGLFVMVVLLVLPAIPAARNKLFPVPHNRQV